MIAVRGPKSRRASAHESATVNAASTDWMSKTFVTPAPPSQYQKPTHSG